MDEGMLDFYRTQGGRRLIDGTLPRIAKALEDIAAALQALQALQAGAPTPQQLITDAHIRKNAERLAAARGEVKP